MNQRFSCAVCTSADKELEAFISELPLETSFHRAEPQEIKCGFGLQGACCKLCANGPCRITPDSPTGVCGADADTIAMRDFLRAVSAGSGCYIHVAENAARILEATALARGDIKGKGALESLCATLRIDGADEHDRAAKAAGAVLADLYRPYPEIMQATGLIAHPQRYKRWEETGILPAGAKSEVLEGIVKTSANLSSDPSDMLLHSLRLGISTGIHGLALTNLLSDALLGEPNICFSRVGLTVVDPSYINIMVTGHQHSMFARLQSRLLDGDVIKKALVAGAKGFKLVGSACVGQEMQLRGAHCAQVYAGHAGNALACEAVLATGAVDAVLTEFGCTLPGIEPICDGLLIKQICIDPVAKKSNAALIGLGHDSAALAIGEIVDEIVAAYKARRGSVKINLPADHGNSDTLTGVSDASLKAFLGGTWDPLVEHIESGRIKGLAGVIGCTSLNSGGHDVLAVGLARDIISRDILVLSAGCSASGIGNCGLMTREAAELAGPNLKAVCQNLGIPPVLNFGPCLAIGRIAAIASELASALGIDVPRLPLVLSVPQWLGEQMLAVASFGLALGLPVHLGTPPFITGSMHAMQALCEGMKHLTGGHMFINGDAGRAAGLLEDIIAKKRLELGFH